MKRYLNAYVELYFSSSFFSTLFILQGLINVIIFQKIILITPILAPPKKHQYIKYTKNDSKFVY